MVERTAESRRLLEEISADARLQRDASILPDNYNFEIAKTVWKIRVNGCRRVALQFPEGLLLYACVISDLLEKHAGCETLIMGDVTYGACCVDDYTCKALQCDLLVHYGHSCLVPIQQTEGILMLYVFVDIRMNVSHFIDTLLANFETHVTIALVSTIQFISTLQNIQRLMKEQHERIRIVIPQCRPLSPGEVLGCTSPKLTSDVDCLLYLGDGRFHLESAMIANPTVAAYQYDPYSKKFTREYYDFRLMNDTRKKMIEKARNGKTYGLILGTLGRQGNMKILERLEANLASAGKETVVVSMSEIFPDKLELFPQVDCWVQVACPRLSIDWATAFSRPLLTPYELAAVLKLTEYRTDSYPMDYYANDSLGPWTNNHEELRPKRIGARTKRPHISVKIDS